LPLSTLFPYTPLFRSNPQIVEPVFHQVEQADGGIFAQWPRKPAKRGGHHVFLADVLLQHAWLAPGAAAIGRRAGDDVRLREVGTDRKSTRLNSSHVKI